MPVNNGEYVQLTAEQIQAALEAELQTQFGNDIDLTESSVFSTLVETLAAVISGNQEQSLEDVYESAFLSSATGDDLDRVVAILGIQRRDAIHATGVERFSAPGKVSEDYVIQRGQTVQTSGGDPTIFETTEAVSLELIDDFEDGSLSEYAGDTGSATVVGSNAYNGSNAVELDATNGAHIYRDDVTIEQGTTFHGHARPTADTTPIVTFGIQPADDTDYFQVALDETNNEARLETVVDGSISSTIDTTAVTISGGNYYEVEVDWNITDNIGVSIKDSSGSELATLGGSDATYQSGHVGIKSGDASGTKIFDYYTTSAVSADIRAVSGGVDGNVGANSITVQPSPSSGVDTVTNLYPTGDTSYTDTSGNVFTVGESRETDQELRERAEATAAGGGAATHDAIVGHIINTLDDVTSVKVYENKTDTDNTGSGGLPPHSFEAVVFGGTDQEVAEAIFEKKAITSRDYSGVNGTSVSETVQAESNGQTRTIEFSRPTELAVDIDIDIVVNNTYIGDDALRDRIVRYIGGIESDGSETIGLSVSENVVINAILDRIVGADDTGVIALDESVDGDPIETTPAETTVDGIRVIDVGENEVATSDATDGSITINTRLQS